MRALRNFAWTEWYASLGIAAAVMLGHVLTNGQYGFHRDELQFMSDARHLDWGFVVYPPLVPLLARLELMTFGVSLEGLRMLSVLAQGLAIVLAGWMAREFGGGKVAQCATALAAGLAGAPLAEGTQFQYSNFDFLWWVVVSCCVVRLLKTGDARWWLAIGSGLGLGMETKYTIGFFLAGIVGGLLLTRERRYLRSGWFWGGVAIGVALVLPNAVWEVQHRLITLHCLRFIHQRDVGEGRARGFFVGQFTDCANLFAAPVWVTGLVTVFRAKRWRMLGWMYLIPLVLFAVMQARMYYVAGIYPMLLAMGAAVAEGWVMRRGATTRRVVVWGFFGSVVAYGALCCAVLWPIAHRGRLREFALERNVDLRDEFGWEEMTKTIAAVRDGFPADARGSVGVLAGNYGDEGAIAIFGPKYGLPEPMGLMNSAWLRGYPAAPPKSLIVVGFEREEAERLLTGCRVAARLENPDGVKTDESEFRPEILVCGEPRGGWAGFWPWHVRFG